MMRCVAAILLLSALTPVALAACWASIDPQGLAEDCPIIVTGTIEKIVEAAPGGVRSDDIASLRIEAIARNELTDVPLKVGDLLAVRMISRNNATRLSTDLNYPVKTRAVWMVMLTSKGEFRIDKRPEQKQAIGFSPNLRTAKELTKQADDSRPALANPAGSRSRAEWIARQKMQEAQRAQDWKAHSAQQKAIRDLAKRFADAEVLDAKMWARFKEAETEVRRGILQLQLHEQPMTGSRFAETAQGILLHELDDNIRTHAVSQLAYCRDPGAKGMEVLAAALRDRSASVRLFACQSVKMRRYEPLADQVRQLQSDPDRQVRDMATATLAAWRKE